MQEHLIRVFIGVYSSEKTRSERRAIWITH